MQGRRGTGRLSARDEQAPGVRAGVEEGVVKCCWPTTRLSFARRSRRCWRRTLVSHVVASVGSADAATEAAITHHPRLAVVDVRMPGGGQATIAGIRQHSPDTVVMVCSSHDDRHTRQSMRDAGAAAYVVKGADDLLDAAYAVMGIPTQ